VTHTFGILGSGRQGTAAAYDLAAAQDASLVVMFDVDDRVERRRRREQHRVVGQGDEREPRA